MGKKVPSLLAGRNQSGLSEDEIRRAINTFLGLESRVNARYDAAVRTAFHVVKDESGLYGEIVFGPDIYPGQSVVDPNSVLGLQAAAAHELTHYHRWNDKVALPDVSMEHLDEALTSLQAILRYDHHLSPLDIRQLIADSIMRLQLFSQDLGKAKSRKDKSGTKK